MLTPPRTAKEYEEMLDFAEQTQQTKQAMTLLEPLLKPVVQGIKNVGGAVSRGVKKLPIGKPAVAPTPYQFGYGVPGAGSAGSAGQAATGLFKWGPAAARLATAPMRLAWNKPLPVAIAGGLAMGGNSAVDEIRNRVGTYADGFSSGTAEALHGAASMPFTQRLTSAFFPQTAMSSDSLANGIKEHVNKRMATQSWPVRMMLGDSIAPSIMHKMQLLQGGKSPDLSPHMKELMPMMGDERLRKMQELWKKIEDFSTQGTNATAAGT